MATEPETLLKLIEAKAEARAVSGTFRGLEDLRGLVDIDGGRVPAHLWAGFLPEPNEAVWVLILDGVAYIVGPTMPKPGNGAVVSASGGDAVVSTIVGNVAASYDAAATYEPGALVKLMWQEGAYIVGLRGAAPTVEIPGAGGTAVTRTVVFNALDSGSYQAGYGWRTNDVWSSANNSGGWFYGSQIADTIPDGARIDDASIFLPAPDRLTGARPFGRHGAEERPGDALTFAGLSTLPETSGWVPIPTGLIDHLKANSGGLGFNLGGWNIWPGTQRVGQSGAVSVTFTA